MSSNLDPNGNPMVRLVIGEVTGGIAAFLVYCSTRLLSYLTLLFKTRFPTDDEGPLIFLEFVLNWTGVIGAAALFVCVTFHHVRQFIHDIGGRSNQPGGST